MVKRSLMRQNKLRSGVCNGDLHIVECGLCGAVVMCGAVVH